jgi:hypothetical protein
LRVITQVSTIDPPESFLSSSPTANGTQPLLDFADGNLQTASNLEPFIALLLPLRYA